MTALSSDRPNTDPSTDLFGHAPFARNLAESICRYPGGDGLVLALYGPWGSGKSTVLSYVHHYIEQKPEAEQPVIVTFNPWWFSGQENLARAFLGQLQAVLPEKYAGFKKLGGLLSEFSEGVGGLIDLTGVTLGAGSLVGGLVSQLKPKPKDVPALKSAISKLLAQEGKRVLVIIDDIDRLVPDETRQLFTVIKALADFPQVVYLLAFDREVAVEALKQQTGIPGERYLEKIIQVPFELPPVDRVALRAALFKQLEMVMSGTPVGLFDDGHWSNVFYDGIDPLIQVPRDIVRFVNTLTVTYPTIVGEVNPVDFIAIEALRVFLPDVYNVVRSNPEKFTGYRTGNDGEKAQLQAFHNSWLKDVSESQRESVRALLTRLFPKLETVWENIHFGAEFSGIWRRELRVCSGDIFPTYFRWALSPGAVSNAELKALIALGNNPEALRVAFIEASKQFRPDGLSKARTLLERLMDHAEEGIDSVHISAFIDVLMDVGDELILESDKKSGLFDFGNESRVRRLVSHLLMRVEQQNRLGLLGHAFTEGRGVAVQAYLLASLTADVDRRKANGGEALLDEASVEDLKVQWVSKIKAVAVADELLPHPQLARLLAAWRHWGSANDSRTWVESAIVSDDGLLEFIPKFTNSSISQSAGERSVKVQMRLNPKGLESYLDIQSCANRLKALQASGAVPELSRQAIEQFLLEFTMIEDGKNPDDPFAFDD